MTFVGNIKLWGYRKKIEWRKEGKAYMLWTPVASKAVHPIWYLAQVSSETEQQVWINFSSSSCQVETGSARAPRLVVSAFECPHPSLPIIIYVILDQRRLGVIVLSQSDLPSPGHADGHSSC
jgi:hypothetical protein